MRETKESPLLRTIWRSKATLPLMFALVCVFACWGCGVKRTVKVDVPRKILQAKTVGFDELLGIIRSYDKIHSLSTDGTGMELTLTSSRKISVGELEKYRSVSGYILLRRPDAVRFVLLMPVSRSTLFDVLSVGDKFSARYPREHKFFEGSNKAKELIGVDPMTSKEFQVPPVRGSHLFEAIFPQSIPYDSPDTRISVREETDAQASYYILSVLKEGATRGKVHRIHTLREIYIERFGLTIARQKVFDEDGRILSDITYTYSDSGQVQTEGFSLPRQIHIDRPQDEYTLDLGFRRKWNINPDLQDEAFVLHPEPEDEIIPLKEKTTGTDSK